MKFVVMSRYSHRKEAANLNGNEINIPKIGIAFMIEAIIPIMIKMVAAYTQSRFASGEIKDIRPK